MEYTCAVCKNTFETGVTDEEADAEMKANFGVSRSDVDFAVLCDDCYRKLPLPS